LSRYIRRFVSPAQLLPMFRPHLLPPVPIALSSPRCHRQNARQSRRRIGRQPHICHRIDRDKRPPTLTRRRSVRFCPAFSASSFESELRPQLDSADDTWRPVEQPPPTSNAQFEPSRRRLPRFRPRLRRRRSRHGSLPSQHVHERPEGPRLPHTDSSLDDLIRKPHVLAALDNQPKRRAVPPAFPSLCGPSPASGVRECTLDRLTAAVSSCSKGEDVAPQVPVRPAPGSLSSTSRTGVLNGKGDDDVDYKRSPTPFIPFPLLARTSAGQRRLDRSSFFEATPTTLKRFDRIWDP
jgi:hypothetical protein